MKTITKDLSQIRNTLSEKRVIKAEEISLNDYQNFLYKRALYGLKVYTQEELDEMHPEKQERITRVYWKAQRVLNKYKQEVINKESNKIMKALFPHSQLTKLFLTELNVTDPRFRNDLTFRQLGIDKPDIVNKLIERRVLPKNFYILDSKNG
jgi:ribosome-interacting GTPase 1